MKGLYATSTTIPLDANGNSTEHPGPNTEKVLTVAALLNLFFGSRFVVNEEGWVNKLQPDEKAEVSFVEAINFHPLRNFDYLLLLVFLEGCAELAPELLIRLQSSFNMKGIGTITSQQYRFNYENGKIRMYMP